MSGGRGEGGGGRGEGEGGLRIYVRQEYVIILKTSVYITMGKGEKCYRCFVLFVCLTVCNNTQADTAHVYSGNKKI